MPAAPPRMTTIRQLVLSLMWFAISFLWGSFLAVVIPFLLVPEHPGPGNPLLVDPGHKNTALALLEGLGLILAMTIQPAAGALSDRFRSRWGRRRPIIVVGAAGACVSLALIDIAPTFWILVGVYCLLQFAMNTSQGAYQGLLPDTVPGEQRGEASGFLGLATLAGQVAGVVATIALPPRVISLVAAALIALSVFITVTVIHEEPAAAAPPAGPSIGRWRAFMGYFAEFRRYPDFCWVVASRFAAYTGLAGIQRFASFYLEDTYKGHYQLFGLTLSGPNAAQQATGATFAVVILFGLLATYPAVKVSARVGRRPVLIAACLMGALGSTLFFFATSLSEVVVFALFVGVAFGMLVSVDWAYMSDLAPKARSGKFLGFSNVATAGSQALAPTLMGPVIDHFNRTSAHDGLAGTAGYSVLFAVSAVFFLTGGLVLSRVRAHHIPEADEPIPVIEQIPVVV
jgi:MFS family permease